MKKNKRNFPVVSGLILIITFLLAGCNSSGEKEMIELSGRAQGTTYSIKFFADADSTFIKGVDSLFKLVDSNFSTYIESSVVSTFNATDSFVEVSPFFLQLMNLSREMNTKTSGAFDPTVGPLVRAYGFGPDGEQKIPDSASLAHLLEITGFEKVIVRGNRIYKTYADMQLDFNAIAQGLTVDLIADFLELKHISDYMVEVGGELKVKGTKPGGIKWAIGIDKPVQTGEERNLMLKLELSEQSVATSGNYRKYYVKDGMKYTHTIDPATGKTVDSELLSATVVTDDCAIADAMATAFMVMGKEKAMKIIDEDREIEGILVYSDSSGSLHTYISPGLAEAVSETD